MVNLEWIWTEEIVGSVSLEEQELLKEFNDPKEFNERSIDGKEDPLTNIWEYAFMDLVGIDRKDWSRIKKTIEKAKEFWANIKDFFCGNDETPWINDEKLDKKMWLTEKFNNANNISMEITQFKIHTGSSISFQWLLKIDWERIYVTEIENVGLIFSTEGYQDTKSGNKKNTKKTSIYPTINWTFYEKEISPLVPWFKERKFDVDNEINVKKLKPKYPNLEYDTQSNSFKYNDDLLTKDNVLKKTGFNYLWQPALKKWMNDIDKNKTT